MDDHLIAVTQSAHVMTPFRQACLEWDAIQQSRLRMNNMLKAFDRMGRPYPEPVRDFLATLQRLEAGYLRVVAAEAAEGDDYLRRVVRFIRDTEGLGPAVLCVLGLIPSLALFPNPAKLWAYLGLAVVDGKAVRVPMPPPPNNPRGPAGMHFSRRIRAYATRRIVDPIIKNARSPYRPVYDQRRAHTVVTHLEWAEERNKKGEPIPNAHYHADAVRYTAKRVWRDIWNAAYDQRSHVTLGLTVGAASAE